MSEEIIYTSAPQGLKMGSRGFCTVASTPGMASTLAALLESLSGYRHLASPGDASNPTVYNHLTARVGGRELHILSRIADAGLDYSGRSNKLVHHVVLGPQESSPTGPTWVQQQLGFHERQWSEEPRILPAGRVPPKGDNPPRPCTAWQSLMGDAGWAGVLAESATKPGGREVWLIYPPGADVLAVVGESIALLPPALRWQATYSTFFTKLPPGVECRWRFVPDGTDEAVTLRKKYELGAIDLCRPQKVKVESEWTAAARAGRFPQFGGRREQGALPAELPFAEPTAPTISIDYSLDPLTIGEAPPPLPGERVEVRPRSRGRARNAYDEDEARGGPWKLAIAATAIVLVLLVFGGAFIFREPLMKLVAGRSDEPHIESSKKTDKRDSSASEQIEPETKNNVDAAADVLISSQLPTGEDSANSFDQDSTAQLHRSDSNEADRPSAQSTKSLPHQSNDSSIQSAKVGELEQVKEPAGESTTKTGQEQENVTPRVRRRIVCLLPPANGAYQVTQASPVRIELSPPNDDEDAELYFYYPAHSATYLPLRTTKDKEKHTYNVMTSKELSALRIVQAPTHLELRWGPQAATEHIRLSAR